MKDTQLLILVFGQATHSTYGESGEGTERGHGLNLSFLWPKEQEMSY